MSMSFQPRVVFVAVRISGFISRSLLLAVIASRYFPMLNLTAVFPVPNRSYATPNRGVMSFQSYPGVDRLGKKSCSAR